MSFAEDRAAAKRETVAHARNVRSQRAVLRAAFKARELNAMEVLEGPNEEAIEQVVAGMKVSQFLPMIPGVAQARTIEILMAAKLSPEKKIGQLSPEERRELALITRGAREAWVPLT